MINKIHDIVLNVPKVKVREVTEIESISTERVDKIFCIHICALNSSVKGQKSGLNLVKMHQSVRNRNNRLGKLRLVFFGMPMK